MQMLFTVDKRTVLKLIEKLMRLINNKLQRRGYQLNYGLNDFNSHSNVLRSRPPNKCKNEKTAILIQGPIRNPILTNKTLEFYRNNFKDVGVILSTWENDPNLKEVNVRNVSRIVKNQPPLIAGIQNLNFQMKSTVAGLRCAQNDGYVYVVKTRSDQAMLSNAALDRLHNRLASTNDSGHERILTTDFNSFIFRPFHMNDQFQFFTVETGLRFWDESLEEVRNLVSTTNDEFPERYLNRRYLRRLGMMDTFDIQVSLKAIRDLYVILDYEELELVWFKGTARDLRFRFPQKVFPWEWSFCRYSDWLELQKDIDPYCKFAEQVAANGT